MPYKDKEKHRAKSQEYYWLHKEEISRKRKEKYNRRTPEQIERAKNRSRIARLQMIDYMGGKCELCSYSKCSGALEFHHVDSKSKEMRLSTAQNFSEKYKKELQKCALLCANCHIEVHRNVTLLPKWILIRCQILL